jgi:hypothetical protein
MLGFAAQPTLLRSIAPTCFTTALGAAVCVGQKMDKKASIVLNRSDCYVFPFFDLHKREPRRGGDLRSPFFCLLFFGESKEK